MAIAVAVAVVFVFSLSFVFTSRTDSSDLGDSGLDSGSFGGFGSTRRTVLALKSDPLKLLQAQEAQLAFSPFTSLWNGSLRIRSSVLFWYFLISLSATVPGLKR
ncbi:hypothetical protein ACFX2G_001527 [Malus domestica]